MESNIYLVTTIEVTENDGIQKFSSSRTVGYFNAFKKADEIVRNNSYDICETIYLYAIIEEVEEGIYPECKNRYWYKYNVKNGNYEPIDEPQILEGIYGNLICYGIG